jgi:pantoate ligase/cytidylate kinase
VRESSGLAYSSRNQYLSVEARKEAALIFQALTKARHHFLAGERRTSTLKALVQEVLSVDAFRVQYVEVVHPQTLVPLEIIEDQGLLALAVHLGTTRLIDNILLRDRSMIIAIDGPAGAGKSTVTRQVAQRLGLMYLDTGAMYRALTWLVLQSGISPEDEAGVAELVSQATLELIPSPLENQPPTVIINGQDITLAIRTLDITRHVSAIAAQKSVRQVLLEQQQRYGAKGGIVVEGRDIATRVFPDAEVKIFLTASVSERAKRRYQDLIRQGEEDIDPLGLEREIAHRDYLDSHRSLAPLVKAEDAIEVNTDGLTIEQVIEKIVELSYSRSKL